MRAVGLATVVLAPRHFIGIGLEAMAAESVMDAELGTAEPAEIRLGPIGRRAILALVFDAVIDPHHRVAGVEDIPPAGFVGMHRSPGGDVCADHRDCIAFPPNNPRPRVAVALAGDDDDLALSIERTAVGAINLPIRLPWSLTEISPINLGLTIDPAEFVAAVNLGAHRLAELVEQHKGALGVDVHVAGHVKRRDAFESVAEQGDDGEVVADRELAAMEQRAARHRKLAAAAGAFPPKRRLRERIDL